MSDNILAVIDDVYEDGVSLIFPGSSVPSQKHYLTNSEITFQAGQRVKCCKISGTILVEYPINSGSIPVGPIVINSNNINNYFIPIWLESGLYGWGISDEIIFPKNIGIDGTSEFASLESKLQLRVTIHVSSVTERQYDLLSISYINPGDSEVFVLKNGSGDIEGDCDPFIIRSSGRIILKYSKDSSSSPSTERVNVKLTIERV